MTDSHDTAPLWRERGGRRAFDVFGVGQNALDRVCEVDGLLQMGEKREMPGCRDLPGGQVVHFVCPLNGATVPGGQGAHSVEPPLGLWVPASHSLQEVDPVSS